MDSSLARYDGKLVYIANLGAPSEKAHVLQSFKMCEAFRRLGLDVELTCPRRRNTAAMEGVDALSYYDVKCPFRLVETNCPDSLRLSASPRIQKMLFVARSTLFTGPMVQYEPVDHSLHLPQSLSRGPRSRRSPVPPAGVVPSIYSSASPMGRKSALRREIPWILRGFQGRLSC